MSAYYNCIKAYANNDTYDDPINYDQQEFIDSITNYDKNLEKDLEYDDNPNEKILNMDKDTESFMRLVANPLNNYYITSIDIYFPKIKNNENKTIRTSTIIPRNGDVLNTIYLEITLPDGCELSIDNSKRNNLSKTNYFGSDFNNLSLQEKFALFNINLDLQIGGVTIWKNTLLSNLFTLICTNINIKSDSNKIQIPIFDFSMMKTTKQTSSLFDYEKGFSQVGLQYHEMRINMDIETNITKFMKCKYIIKGRQLESDKRQFLVKTAQEYCIMLSSHEESDNLEFYNLQSCLGMKTLIIYFEPKNDDYIDYPKINFIEVIQDDIIILIEQEDLLELEMFDTNMIVLPLTKEFNSWKNINNFYENPHKYMSKSIVGYKEKFHLNIYYESKPDNFTIHFTQLIPNIYRQMHGMGSLAFL